VSDGKQAGNAWRVVTLLFLANLFNYYDRAVPAVLVEPVRREWGLTDTQLGLAASAFTVIYAVAGVPIGRLADRWSRKNIIGWGLLFWSALTGVTGSAWSFGSFLIFRMLVGIGESSYAPSATSLIGDLFPADKRSRAVGIFMLGLPIGLVVAFFTTGALSQYFGSWRAPFYVAAMPGMLLALCMFFIREPARGAAETAKVVEHKIDRPIRRILKTPTLWWLIISGVALNIATYGTNGFLVPLIQRFFNLPLQSAGVATGVIVGISGLIGLTFGAIIADKLHRVNERARLIYGAVSMFGAALLIYFALKVQTTEFATFVALYAMGWLLQYNFYACSYPALQDVVDPRLRATAMSILFALVYILGGSAGPLLVGAFSDSAAHAAMVAAGATQMTDQFRGLGLRSAMELVPAALFVSGVGFLLATRTFPADAAAMRRSMAAAST
jgi:MFS family permease